MHRVLYHTRALPPAAIADASQASALTANVAAASAPQQVPAQGVTGLQQPPAAVGRLRLGPQQQPRIGTLGSARRMSASTPVHAKHYAGGGDPTYGRRSETQVDVAGSDFPSSSSSDDDRQSSDFGGTPPESDSVDSSTFGCVST
jgi:hypothetical protein